MARYFFHTDGIHLHHDSEGFELEESQLAAEALDFLAEALRGRSGEFWSKPAFRIMVTDEAGLIVYTLDIADFEAPAIALRRALLERDSSASDV